MTAPTLIVLFGHENDDKGKLSPIAVTRCRVALRLLDDDPDALLLPTGAFGRNFNRTHHPHSAYLTKWLSQKGVDPARILPGTKSSNTLEDCLCVRKFAIDRGFDRLVLVTSDYHMRRVKFIDAQILEGLTVSFVEAPQPPDFDMRRDSKNERRSYRGIIRDWVTPPLYESGKAFPEKLYEVANQEHRHYDTISLSVVTAMVALSGYLSLLDPVKVDSIQRLIALSGGLLFNLLALVVYERTAQAARTARRTMHAIEFGFGMRGFSANYRPAVLFPKWVPTVRQVVIFLWLGLSVMLGVSAAITIHRLIWLCV